MWHVLPSCHPLPSPPHHPTAHLTPRSPTEYRIADLSQVDSLRPEFDDCQLWLGGDVGPEATHLLHGVPGLAGSMEVLPGVFVSRGGAAGLQGWGSHASRRAPRCCVAGAARAALPPALLLARPGGRAQSRATLTCTHRSRPLCCPPASTHRSRPLSCPPPTPTLPQLGGFQAAKAGLGEGRLAADDFRLFTRYAGGWVRARARAGGWEAGCALVKGHPQGRRSAPRVSGGGGEAGPGGLQGLAVRARERALLPGRRQHGSAFRAPCTAPAPASILPTHAHPATPGWGPGQLEAEVRRGVWIPVSASAAAVLRRGLPAGLGGPVAARQVDHLSRPSVAALWHFIARVRCSCGWVVFAAVLARAAGGGPELAAVAGRCMQRG